MEVMQFVMDRNTPPVSDYTATDTDAEILLDDITDTSITIDFEGGGQKRLGELLAHKWAGQTPRQPSPKQFAKAWRQFWPPHKGQSVHGLKKTLAAMGPAETVHRDKHRAEATRRKTSRAASRKNRTVSTIQAQQQIIRRLGGAVANMKAASDARNRQFDALKSNFDQALADANACVAAAAIAERESRVAAARTKDAVKKLKQAEAKTLLAEQLTERAQSLRGSRERHRRVSPGVVPRKTYDKVVDDLSAMRRENKDLSAAAKDSDIACGAIHCRHCAVRNAANQSRSPSIRQ